MKSRIAFLGSLLVSGVIGSATPAYADREIGLGFNYDPRIAVGGLRGLVPQAAFAGLQGKWEYYAIANRLTVGFGVQYHYFQEGGESTTVLIPNGAATAPFTRYAYFLTIIPTVRYFPWGPTLTTARPFVELGLGGTTATSAVLASDLSVRRNEGGFVAQPSVGVLWTLASVDTAASANADIDPWVARAPREAMFAFATSLSWAFTTADVVTASNVSYVGVQLGVYSKL